MLQLQVQKPVGLIVSVTGGTIHVLQLWHSVTMCCIGWFDSLMLQVQVQKPVG